MALRLRELILKGERSPNHARQTMVAEGFDMPCTRTIYNHIEHGDIGICHGQKPDALMLPMLFAVATA